MNFSIPLQSKVGSVLQASKWQKHPMLIDENEMNSLFEMLKPFWIVQTSGMIPIGEEVISYESFLEVYHHYIAALRKGEISTDPRIRPYFSSVWTTSATSLYAVRMNESHSLIKVDQPVIQLQAHRFDYSSADNTFRSMVMGHESISWGIQFSYPYLCQDKNFQILKVNEGPQFLNTSLFKKLQQWMRANTITTPFEVEGKRVNVPIRLGKECFRWINSHPQLYRKGLRVSV